MDPTLLLIGGTHGAGKSTLADELAARLGWMVVSRDRVRAGIAWTEAEASHVPAGDLSKRAVSAFFETAELLLSRGASIVMESAFRRGISENDLKPLVSMATVRYIHCVVPRAVAVERCRRRPGPEFVGAMLDERDEERWSRVEQPLDLGLVPLVVDTSGGYSPPLSKVAAFARSVDEAQD